MDWIILLIVKYGYFIIFPVIVVEGPIASIIVGFLASLGYLNIFVAFPVAVVADLTGDIIHYAIGRWGREKIINRWGKYFNITLKKVETLEKHFAKHGGKTLIVGKGLHGVGGTVLVTAGISRMPFLKFLGYNLAATIMKSSVLMLVGFYFGHALNSIDSYLRLTGFILAGLATLLIAYYLFYNPKTEKEYKDIL